MESHESRTAEGQQIICETHIEFFAIESISCATESASQSKKFEVCKDIHRQRKFSEHLGMKSDSRCLG